MSERGKNGMFFGTRWVVIGVMGAKSTGWVSEWKEGVE